MPDLVNPSRMGYLLLLAVLVAPAAAHNVQTAEDVGGTLHIEPNDNPQAGKPALTWFALTRRGGQVISLKECNCQLAVYAEPRDNSQPVLEPTLEVVKSAEYQGIPGAAIAFPKTGAYELELRGTPKPGANFQPFELRFPVTVTGASTSAASSPQPSRQATPQTPATGRALPTFTVPAVIITLGALWFFLRRSQPK